MGNFREDRIEKMDQGESVKRQSEKHNYSELREINKNELKNKS
jgi:hypothetical protein